jgi:hypothetical protein
MLVQRQRFIEQQRFCMTTQTDRALDRVRERGEEEVTGAGGEGPGAGRGQGQGHGG